MLQNIIDFCLNDKLFSCNYNANFIVPLLNLFYIFKTLVFFLILLIFIFFSKKTKFVKSIPLFNLFFNLTQYLGLFCILYTYFILLETIYVYAYNLNTHYLFVSNIFNYFFFW